MFKIVPYNLLVCLRKPIPAGYMCCLIKQANPVPHTLEVLLAYVKMYSDCYTGCKLSGLFSINISQSYFGRKYFTSQTLMAPLATVNPLGHQG